MVRNRQDLLEKMIPFFERYPLYTQKKNDFSVFKKIVNLMSQNRHLTFDGFTEIVYLAYSMNAYGYRRKVPQQEILHSLKSSETLRQNS